MLFIVLFSELIRVDVWFVVGGYVLMVVMMVWVVVGFVVLMILDLVMKFFGG